MTRSGPARILLATLVVAMVAGLVALGVWQLQRRTWKLALIAQVEARLAAVPVPAPGPERWPRIGREDAYTRVRLTGRWGAARPVFAQATTALGAGYWVIAPFESDRGFTVLVNRGFVPAEARAALVAPAGAGSLTGLLRVSEPGGGFLRSNDPAADRWYSRDVAAIAQARGVRTVAPYFVDADAAAGTRWPRGGMTVVRFPNSHLSYALTWFAMAALLAGASVAVRRRGRSDG